MMNQLRERMTRFMIGRYGIDRLGQFLLTVGMIILAVNLFVRNYALSLVVMVVLIVCYYRMFSRDINKRYGENQKFERMRFRVTEKFKKVKFRTLQMKDYHIYKCPSCGQKIRIPRGKGKISIHCPKCSTDFIKKS